MGMKTPMVMIATRENSLVPNQRVNSGTQAMGGTGRITSKSGLKTALKTLFQPMAIPKGTPTQTEKRRGQHRRMETNTW
jgi:hypothetical protein